MSSSEALGPALAGLDQLSQEDFDAIARTDEFRMSSMKVLPCSKRYVHDWTECPFAHPQEKARRRDPRVHHYTGIACPSMKREGCCAFGDHCPYAHNVFEYWLHPTRYRTQLCNDGSNCKRKICFFAHSLDELRVPACKPFVSPEALAGAAASAAADAEAKRKAATVGSPMSAFAALSPGPSPQRSSLEAMRLAQQAGDAQMSGPSGHSVGGPSSPSTTDETAAGLGSSPDSSVRAALQQLAGAGFSSQEQQVIELVTSLLAQEKVSAEQAASILQQMLPSGTLNQLQAHLTTPRAADNEARRFGEPQRQSFDSSGSLPPARSSFDPSPSGMLPPQQQQLSLEHVAAMQAAQNMGYYMGSAQQYGQAPPQYDPRMSTDSLRSSFDTGADTTEQQRRQVQHQAAQQQAAQSALDGTRPSEDSSRMSFETNGRGSMDMMGTPRASLDATYPPNLGAPSLSGTFPGQFYSGQLSSVPEQFPMINAPSPTTNWTTGRYSMDSAADRLSADLNRLSFEHASRMAPQPTANAYASSFFAANVASAPLDAVGLLDRRSMSLPQLSHLRTSAPAGSPGVEDEEAAQGRARAAASHRQAQLLGGTAAQRMQ